MGEKAGRLDHGRIRTRHFIQRGKLLAIIQPVRFMKLIKTLFGESGNKSSTADVINLLPWQLKLKNNLASQLAREELKPIVVDFFDKLKQNQPGLANDEQSIADYLICGNPNRHLALAQFLTAVEPYKQDAAREKPIRIMLAYLLQTLVRKCRDELDRGLTRIPVESKQTAALVGAARTTIPHIPSYTEEALEHKNGQKNALFQNIGEFIPESGTWNVDDVCQNIAKDLLISLGDAHDSFYTDPLQELADRLSAFADAPENAPKQGLLVNRASSHHPLQVEEVAARLHRTLGELLWIYVYGGQGAEEWLHISEGKMRGLIRRYENQSQVDEEASKQKQPEDKPMNPGINLSNIGPNTTVNIVTGQQNGSQVGHDNAQSSGIDYRQLQDLLVLLKQRAETAEAVGEQGSADIAQAVKDIESEIPNKNHADKSVLAKAKAVLDGFKDVAGIAEQVDKIAQLLLPLIG